MKLFLTAVLAALISWAGPSEAASSALTLKVFNRGGGQPSADLVPGALAPTSGGVTNVAWATTSISPSSFGIPGRYAQTQPTMARWTTVPFSTNPTTVSALAYHQPTLEEYAVGIVQNMDYVEAICDGGTASRRGVMTYNPENNTTEYNWPVVPDVTVWPDGLHECRLITVPLTGQARILQGDKTTGGGSMGRSLFFYTNFGGSFVPLVYQVERTGGNTTDCGTLAKPCQTASYALTRMAAVRSDLGGSIVCLGPSTAINPHPWGAASGNNTRAANNQYVTISSCGLPRSSVYVQSSAATSGSTSGLRTRKIRAHELTMIGEPFYGGNTGTGTQLSMGWIDNVSVEGKGALVSGFVFDAFDGGLYITDTTVQEVGNFSPGSMIRNTTIDQIGGDALSGGSLAINVTVTNANDRTYATGTSLAGSNVITNVSNFARLRITAPIEFCGRVQTDSVVITAMDPVLQTVTFDKACLTSLTDATIFSAKHSDVVQYAGGTVFSNIIYLNIQTDFIYGTAWFTSFAGTQVNNIAIVDSFWNNTREPGGFSLAQFNRPMTNAMFLNSTWLGSRVYAGSTFTAVDFSWINNTCSNPRAMPTGVIQMGSPTCVP